MKIKGRCLKSNETIYKQEAILYGIALSNKGMLEVLFNKMFRQQPV